MCCLLHHFILLLHSIKFYLFNAELVGSEHVSSGESPRTIDIKSSERGFYLTHCVHLILELKLAWLGCPDLQTKQYCRIFWNWKIGCANIIYFKSESSVRSFLIEYFGLQICWVNAKMLFKNGKGAKLKHEIFHKTEEVHTSLLKYCEAFWCLNYSKFLHLVFYFFFFLFLEIKVVLSKCAMQWNTTNCLINKILVKVFQGLD